MTRVVVAAALAQTAPAPTTLRVTREPLVDGANVRISPLQYGQFVEYLCDLVPSMWAERLCDGSFEGLSPYQFEYVRAADDREHPWLPCGATNRLVMTHDRESKVSGDCSLRLSAEGDSPCTVGTRQEGIYAERNAACVFSVWSKQQGLATPLHVRLHRESETLAECVFTPTGEWKKFSARLVPTAPDANATLTIEFHGPATVWLDNASLTPEQTVGGWRPDVVAALRALKPGVIRFGGSALDDRGLGDFEWRDTVGDVDRRKPFRAWGGLQPAGAGLEEFVQLCRAVDAEPLICVRVTQRTPKDAADQVEYFNGAPDSPMGRLRAQNGHADPCHILYWQIGNEQGGPEYERRLPDFCRAMKAVDPTIELFASYPSAGVLDGAGDLLDYVCPHHYGCADLVGMQRDFDSIRQLLRGHSSRRSSGREIRVAVTEWNTTAGDMGPRRAMLWSLANALACARYHNLLHRNCDLVQIANRSNLSNSFCSGILQTDNHRLYTTPTYYAQQMYATLAGERPLRVDGASGPLDVSATLSADGRTLALFVVNDTLHEVARSLDVTAFTSGAATLSITTLADHDGTGEPDVTNGFDRPDRIAPTERKLRVGSGSFNYAFPPLSLTVLRLTSS
jgi:alpha-N-arabinofuranosidase